MKVTRKRTLSALAALAALAFAVDAQAFWGSSGGSWGSSGGSSGGSWGSSGGSWGSSGGSWGSRGSHGSWGSRGSHGSWGSHGSHGSYGGHVTVYYGSHGSHGSHGSGGGVIYESAPVYESAPAEVDVEVEASGANTRGSSRYGTIVRRGTTGSGTLRVSVPENSVVYVNDNRTTSTGSERTYVSRGLASGRNYAYEVRVEFEVDGKTVSQTKAASLTAGSNVQLVFDAPATVDSVAEKPEPTETDLTLAVPADAKVTLAGSLTKQTGEQRQFSTTRLSPGETWENYVIRVEVEHDGKTVEMERTITLTGGQSHEETFDFDAQLLAAK